MSEQILTRGNYRVRLEPDTYAEAPDDDGQGYVFSVHYGPRGWVADELHRDYGDAAPTFDLAGALTHFGTDWQLVERYLHMWHDVVSFDYTELDRSGPTHVFIVTRAQAQAWGFDPEATDPEQAHAVRRLTMGAVATWRTWAEGDVWSYVLERRETWTNAAGDTLNTWEHVDSLSGLYGYAYASEEARRALEGMAGASVGTGA